MPSACAAGGSKGFFMSARSEHIAFDLGPYDGLGPRSRRETVDANDPAMFSERVEMLERTGRRLGRLLGELDDIDAEESTEEASSSPLVVTGLDNDTEYRVRVRAVNEHGTGPWSDTDTATPTGG